MVVEALIQEGQAELDIRNNRKQTSLTLACAQGHCGLVELLVSKGNYLIGLCHYLIQIFFLSHG